MALPAIGCGSEGEDAAASPFCDASREWAVHELTPPDEMDPASVKAHFTDYDEFVATSLDTAPEEVADEWQLYADEYRAKFRPVIEKFHYSFDEVGKNGTPEEQAIFTGKKSAEASDAFDAILSYEGRVCGSQTPAAADVSFEGEKPGEYCEVAGKLNQMLGEITFGGASPSALKNALTGDEYARLTEKERDVAPASISTDVDALVRFDRTTQIPTVAKYDYDIKKLILNGSPADRAAFQHQTPSIRDAASRVSAFEEQVCGA
jgi:hypothetical protein